MALQKKDTVLLPPKDLKTKLAPDGTFVTMTYGHWTEGEAAYVVSVWFKLEELDGKVK
jgi:hypothetical protein